MAGRKSRRSLVYEYLEGISRAALEKHQDIIRDYVRGRYGIYALYRKDRLYYVGLASNLRSRLKTHLKDRHGHSWDRFSVYLTTNESQLQELEALLLRITRPAGNKQRGKLKGATNIKPVFRKKIREYYRQQVEEMMGGKSKKKKFKAQEERKSQEKEKGRRPALARYAGKVKQLRARYKGRTLRASVRKDGTVTFKGKKYASPSLAGKAAIEEQHAVNGWLFWEYKHPSGNWMLLDTLRR